MFFYSIYFSGRRSNKHKKVEPKTNPIYHFLENEGLDLPVSSKGGNEFGLELKNRPEEPVSSDSEDEFGLVYKKHSKVPVSSHSENEIGLEFNKEDNTETPNNENNDDSEPERTEMVTPETSNNVVLGNNSFLEQTFHNLARHTNILK